MQNKKSVSRRKFVKNAGLAALGVFSAPIYIPGTVLGKNGGIAPGNRITLASIGVGGMGTANLEGFLNQDRAQVVAVCDVDRAHLNRARDLVNRYYRNNDCATYKDFRELLDRGDLDAVCISVPDQWHAIPAIMAAQRGLDIYAEKPLAYTISEGRAIVNAVNRNSIVWQTGSWQRSQQKFRFACELVRNGRIGTVHTVRVGLPAGNNIDRRNTSPSDPPDGFDYDMWLGPAPWAPYCEARCHWNFRWISDYSGGQLTDWAGHHCDIAHWGMNTELSAPIEIEGIGQFPLVRDGLFDTPEKYRIEYKYAEGFTMIVADSTQQPKGMGVHFEGTEGWIHVNRSGIDSHPKSLLRAVFAPDEIHLYMSEDHYGNFLDCVLSRSKTITPVEIAHHSIMVGHLGNIAMKTGHKLYWDIKSEKFINDHLADRYLWRPMRGPWHL
jgi:predicted dehydrogenase